LFYENIVVDHGGIGEYVVEGVGIKLTPVSRERLIDDLRAAIQTLVEDEVLRLCMSARAIGHAAEFEWGRKADQLALLYQQLVEQHRA
jgi:glycosyltransferase involved in cell wall biosynthesis